MSLQVLVTFPGNMTLGSFEDRLKLLTKMGCSIHLGTDMAQPIGKMSVGKVFRPTAPIQKGEPLMTEELTPQELSLLDQGLQSIYDNQESPLLDHMEKVGVLRSKPNMSREIRQYFSEHPGHSPGQAASHLADKFESIYGDINDAFRRIKSLISVLCTRSSPQYCLDRRGGRGDMAQIHLIA